MGTITITGMGSLLTSNNLPWVFAMGNADFTLSEHNNGSRNHMVIGDIVESLLACYNSADVPMGINVFGEHYCSPFTIIDDNYNVKVDYNSPSYPSTSLNLYINNRRNVSVSIISGMSPQVSLVILVTFSDGQKCFLRTNISRTNTIAQIFDNNITALSPQGSPTLLPGELTISSNLYVELSNLGSQWLPTFGYVYDDITVLQDFLNGIQPYVPDTDPFFPGGISEPGGGGGDFDDPSEDVTDPAVPDISAVDTGFITLFNPSVSQLNSLASYMWSAGFDLETFKKIFANPMDCILGLSILPKIVPAGGSRTVTVGNISTGVSMTVAASQYVKFDCGSVTVKRYSNSFLDYAPYTKVSIYLPFIGIHELSVDDVMNKSVHVKYNIDILSGACAAFVICGGTTLYTYNGQCAASVPVTSGDWSTMINGVIGAVGGALRAAVGGAAVGGLLGAAGAGVASLASSAMDVAGMKPSIQHSGNMGGMGGMMGVKTPFLIITRPQQAIPGQQNKYTGYPAFVTKELNALEGYTEIEEIHLENIPGTEQEITEIYNLLKSGVIL